jgi:tetratricopeptide (TPR) repeat protein
MFSIFKNRLAAALIGCAVLAISAQPAQANILDEIQVQPDNLENVVRVQFSTRIQFIKATTVGNTNTIQVIFQIVQGINIEEINSVETLNSKPFEQLPAVNVSYPPQTTKIRKLTLQIGKGKQPVNVKVRAGSNGRSIDIIFGDTARQHSAVPDGQRYALTLLRTASRDDVGGKIIPREFQDYDVFTSQQTRDGKTLYELNLGYFATPEQAEMVRAGLLAQFPDAAVTDLVVRREEMLAAASAKAKLVPGQVQSQAQPQAQAPLVEVEDRAAALMPKAQEALKTGNYELAVNSFNQILLLPPNQYSQEAQELIGVARVRNGEPDKAKAEFELYLKLFPDGPGADRVRQQLAQLNVAATTASTPKAKPRRDETVIKTISGSLSQYYFGGQSQTQTAFNTPTTSGTSSLSSIDQSSLKTHLDLVGRYRDGDADQRLVFRDDNIISFLDTSPNLNHVLAANYSYKGLQNGFNATLGRQVGTSGGVLGRFDGAQVGYYFAPKWRANFVAGVPVEFPSLGSDRQFWGISLDADELTERLRGKVYYIDQTVDGILDRRAVGSELGFYDSRGFISALVDYDVSYSTLNIGTVQGNWQTAGGTIYNFLLERRRAPLLTTSNALYNSAVTSLSPVPTSIGELLQTNSETQIRQWAADASATSEQAMVGFLSPINETWQVGADFNLTNTGALPGETLADGTVLAPTPATGNIYTYSMRGIGSGLLFENDINVFTLSLNKGDTYHGELLAFNNTTRLDVWTLEPSLKYYQQTSDPDINLVRWTPEIRLTYLWRNTLSLEADYTYEYSTTSSPGNNEVSQQHLFYLGYRWDI